MRKHQTWKNLAKQLLARVKKENGGVVPEEVIEDAGTLGQGGALYGDGKLWLKHEDNGIEYEMCAAACQSWLTYNGVVNTASNACDWMD